MPAQRQKRLLVLGAGPWQLPTLRKARELGLYVVVTDGAKDRPGFEIADAFEVADIANPPPPKKSHGNTMCMASCATPPTRE